MAKRDALATPLFPVSVHHYRVICDNHREGCLLIVSLSTMNAVKTSLADNGEAYDFLQAHLHCPLRLLRDVAPPVGYKDLSPGHYQVDRLGR